MTTICMQAMLHAQVSRASVTTSGTPLLSPPYVQGCDLAWNFSNVIVYDRPQPWAYRSFLFAYHIPVYMK